MAVSSCDQAEQSSMPVLPSSIPMKVGAVTVNPKSLAFEIFADGEARAGIMQPLFFEITGRLKEMRISAGDDVQKGDTLAVLDDLQARLEMRESGIRLEEATYAFESAMLSFDRKERQVPDTIRKSIWHSSGLARAEAEYLRSSLARSGHYLIAPFDGRISRVEARSGQYVTAGELLGTLYVPESIRIEAHVLELHNHRVTKGMRGILTDMSGNSVSGQVESVEEWVDDDGFFRVWIKPDSTIVWPGGHVTVNLLYRQHDGFSVPVRAVMARSDRLMVYVVKNREARWQYIKAGMQTDEYLEVIEGIEAGDTVLTERLAELAHGMPVIPDLSFDEKGR